ncbi:MAG: GntR family transcriptional regulator [Chloroflexota bacterium]
MTRFRLESGPVPLHHQVYLHLLAALDEGQWRVGDRVPPERELAEQYGCSLITIRRALGELTREGRLERTRGRGTFVRRPPVVRDIAARAGFLDEMRARGLEPYAIVVTAQVEPASPAIAAALRIAPGAPIYALERVRGAEGVPYLLERAHLSAARFPGLLEDDFATASLYEVLERRFGVTIAHTRETISAVVPTAREASLLELRSDRPAICLEGAASGADGEPVEHSRTVVSPEHAQYFIETSGARARSLEPIDPGIPTPDHA